MDDSANVNTHRKQGLKANEDVRIINAVEGENTITIRTAQV